MLRQISAGMIFCRNLFIVTLPVSPLHASKYLGEITWKGVGAASGQSFTAKAVLSYVGGPPTVGM